MDDGVLPLESKKIADASSSFCPTEGFLNMLYMYHLFVKFWERVYCGAKSNRLDFGGNPETVTDII